MWKHDAVSVSQCQRVSVCGQRRPSALVTRAGGRRRGWGRYYQALVSVAMMTSRHTHTHIRHTCTSISSGLSLPPLAPLSVFFSLSLSHIQTDAHTKTQTHAPKPENYSLACERWADGLPNDCCVQCKGSVLHSHYTSSLQLTRPQSTDLAFIYFTF